MGVEEGGGGMVRALCELAGMLKEDGEDDLEEGGVPLDL